MRLSELIKKQNTLLGEKLDISKEVQGVNTDPISSSELTNGILVFSSLYNIYMFDDEPIKVVRRPSKITNLCATRFRLFDAGYYGIFDTIENKLVATRNGSIRTMYCFKGNLFDGGDYGIFKTLEDLFIGNRDGPVSILTAFGNKLIDIGVYGVYETLSHKPLIKTQPFNKVISVEPWGDSLIVGTVNGDIIHLTSNAILAKRDGPVITLKVWKDSLYDAGDYGIYNTKNNELIATRDHRVDFLFVWENELYDAGPYGIYNTTANTKIALINFITSIAIVPKELAYMLRKKK